MARVCVPNGVQVVELMRQKSSNGSGLSSAEARMALDILVQSAPEYAQQELQVCGWGTGTWGAAGVLWHGAFLRHDFGGRQGAACGQRSRGRWGSGGGGRDAGSCACT